MLVGDNLLFRDTGPYPIILMNVCRYNRCHGNAIKGFWALWHNIYDHVYYFRLSHYSWRVIY
jgi:hypothetical protein